MAPPPPPAEKRTRLMTPAEASDPETVSLLMMFDDLVRNQKVNHSSIRIENIENYQLIPAVSKLIVAVNLLYFYFPLNAFKFKFIGV